MEKNIITKSNTLIEAKYKLKLEEQRLILFLVSKIQPNDVDFKEYEISIKEFSDLVNILGHSQYDQFKIISENLISKTLKIVESDNSVTIVSWLASSNYSKGNGIVKLSFSPRLKPYLLQLKNNFTSYKLENILYLKSIYSIRVYELLKQYEKLGLRLIYLKELKEILSANQSSYNDYFNFKQKVIRVAEKELKEKTDIYFEFEEIKELRKVTKIRFLIYKNNFNNNSKTIEQSNAESVKGLKKGKKKAFPEITDKGIQEKQNLKQNTSKIGYHDNKQIHDIQYIIFDKLHINVSDKQVDILIKASNNDLERLKQKIGIAVTQDIKNLVGWLKSALEASDDQYQQIETKKAPKKNKIVNYTGRTWDYEQLEKLEQEYLINNIKSDDKNSIIHGL